MTEKRPVDSSSDAKLTHEIEGLLAVDPAPELFGRLRSRLAEEPRSPGARVTGYKWFKFLLTGSIRVPVPVGLVVAVVLALMVVALVRRQAVVAPGVPSINLVDFGPVNDVNVRVIRGYESN
jgi:hypothetical protein